MSSSGVEFDEDKLKYAPRATASGGVYTPLNQYGTPSTDPRMVRWMIKKGIVKSPAAAQMILITLVIINLIITFIVIKYFL